MHMTPPPVVIHASSIIQAVHYDLNPDYPNVVSHFQGQAKRLLGTIPGTGLVITLPLNDPRSHKVEVTGNKSHGKRTTRISKVTVWNSLAERETYLKHPNLTEWCQWILHGWRLRGSNLDTLAERRQEFIRAVLSGSAPPTEWAEDIEVPDTDRPWLGEALSIGTVVCLGTPE